LPGFTLARSTTPWTRLDFVPSKVHIYLKKTVHQCFQTPKWLIDPWSNKKYQNIKYVNTKIEEERGRRQ